MSHSTRSDVLQTKELVQRDEQVPEQPIQRLVAQCQELADQYHTTPQVTMEQAWWKAFHHAGVCLHDALEDARDCWHKTGLTTEELEHAYMALIHVAYYFEPGGVAEAIFQQHGWIWSHDEAERSVSVGMGTI
jgi:hypothetical protein